ncbi:MAG: hypothetical protein KF856_10115 [Cyclobacteriaceae bacterium]|nr:hypothetical protein [Cyclobacteriaceae bacterium]
MIRVIILFSILSLFGCETKSSHINEINNSQTDSIISKIDREIELPKNKTLDTLNYYQKTKTQIPPELYKSIFNQELLAYDKIFLREIKKPFDSIIPVIVIFKTVESDREKEYVDLCLFDYKLSLLNSFSLEYEMDWDLFRQEYHFLNDSVFEISQYKGLNYDADSTVKTTLKIKFDKAKLLDTMKIEMDTLRY